MRIYIIMHIYISWFIRSYDTAKTRNVQIPRESWNPWHPWPCEARGPHHIYCLTRNAATKIDAEILVPKDSYDSFVGLHTRFFSAT